VRRTRFKRVVLIVSKYLGLFWLTRHLTRHGLRILCYHGASLGDEHAFQRELFMSPKVFERRLRYLKDKGFVVLLLDEAVERLRRGTLPQWATVITIDDGFYSTYRQAWPLLKHFGFPATLYVTTYYVVKGNPVFGLIVGYMFWKTTREVVDLTGLGLPVSGSVSLQGRMERAQLVDQIVEYGESRCDEERRFALADELATRLGIDYESLVRGRQLSLVTLAELKELVAEGLDVQCHTHRHEFPEEEALALRELADNRSVLEGVVGRPLQHFCYPNGRWSERHEAWLSASGMKTATTCRRGLNYASTSLFRLHRFLDGEHLAQVEFEAEMCGYGEMLRRGKRAVLRLIGRGDSSTGRVSFQSQGVSGS
jgi:peptidoglycan/xylan/chitin deacetylase (PgdA/CDA1 family)